MVQNADYAGLVTSLPTVEEVLDVHASELGQDLIAYRNHVYRVVNLCLAIVGDSPVELEKIAVAAVFHDLGIWTNHTFDYIAPSVVGACLRFRRDEARPHRTAEALLTSCPRALRRIAIACSMAAVAAAVPRRGLSIMKSWMMPL
jgi:hypothetical protein